MNKLAKKIAAALLDKGLADSTWRDQNPDAYTELLDYRIDIENQIADVLDGDHE